MPFTRVDLEEKIKEIYGIDKLTPLIEKQITSLVMERKYKYKDIARALYYFYIEKEGDLSKARGIGIVPYVMEESVMFFRKKEMELEKQKQEAANQKQSEQLVITCNKIGKQKRKKKIINIQNIKEDN